MGITERLLADIKTLKAEVDRLTVKADAEGKENIRLWEELAEARVSVKNYKETCVDLSRANQERAEARELIRAITSELGGALSAFEYELRDVMSNTNYNILSMKVASNNAWLESHKEE